MVACLPLRASSAQDAVPLRFSQGDVLSAEVLNAIFSRLNQATNEVTVDDLLGTWTITHYMPFDGQPGNGSCRSLGVCTFVGTIDSVDGFTRFRTDTVTFSKSGDSTNYSEQNYSAFFPGLQNSPGSGTFSIVAETAIFRNTRGGFSFFYARKKSATRIVLQDIMSGSGSFSIIVLAKQQQAPVPPTSLTSSVSGKSVALKWTDQSPDETGFKVQTKTSVKGNWSTLTTTAANATSFTATAVVGNNWYRVLATNVNGDSITSNEIVVEVK
jgi:hypothetical protein